MTRTRNGLAAALLVSALAVAAVPAFANEFGSPSGTPSIFGFSPKVPVSALARPAAWFDPSRLHFATSVTVGSGFSGGGTQGLQVTSLSYQFKSPAWMRVNVGNAFGSSPTANGKMFLEGVDFGIRPFGNFLVEVHYKDIRSPLQYGQYSPYGDYSPFQRSSFFGE